MKQFFVDKSYPRFFVAMLAGVLTIYSCPISEVSTVPNIPKNLKPSSNEISTSSIPTLSWDEVEGAQGYEVQIANILEDISSAAVQKVNLNSYTPPTALHNLQTYNWRVRTISTNGALGEWTKTNSLPIDTVKIRNFHASNAPYSISTKPILSWTAVNEAAKYKLRISETWVGVTSAKALIIIGTSYIPNSILDNAQMHYWQVKPIAANESEGSWSEIFNLYINWGTIRNLSPLDGANIFESSPTLSWNATIETQKYEVQIADSKTNLQTATTYETPTNSYTIPTALTLGTYYWHVRAIAIDGTEGNWSNINSVVISSGNITEVTPPNNANTFNTQPRFSWTPDTEVARYEIQFARNQEKIATANTKEITSKSYTPDNALVADTYQWRVRAISSSGSRGIWSNTTILNLLSGKVTGLTPTAGTSTTDTTPKLNWDAFAGITNYEIQIADTEANLVGSNIYKENTNSHTSVARTPDAEHYWRVRAVGDDNTKGEWSTTANIRINSGAIKGLSPVDDSTTFNHSPTLSWVAVTSTQFYELQIDTSEPSGTTPIQRVNTNSHMAQNLADGIHYWKVRAVAHDGTRGAWGTTTKVKVFSGTIGNLSPADGSSTFDNTPELKWDAVDGAKSYELQIETTALSEITTVKTTGENTYTTTALTEGQSYNWRVRAIADDNSKGTWSGTNILRVFSGTIGNLSSEYGSRTLDNTPELKWDAVDGAKSYELQIETTALSETTTVKTTGENTYTTTALTEGQSYNWRVRAIADDNSEGTWSGTHILRVFSGTAENLSPADE